MIDEQRQIKMDYAKAMQALQLHQAGHMQSEIARRLGCSVQDVASVLEARGYGENTIPMKPVLVAETPAPFHIITAHKPILNTKPSPDISWTREMIADLWTMPLAAVQQKYKLKWHVLSAKRKELGVPNKPRGNFSTAKFTDQMIALLGKRSDRQLARNFHLDVNIVTRKRRALKIPSFRSSKSPWTKEDLALLGKIPDPKLAKKMGVNVTSIAKKRNKLGIVPFTVPVKWTKAMIGMLGTMTDPQVALELSLSKKQVIRKRIALKIPGFLRRRFHWTPEHLALLGKMQDTDFARKFDVNRVVVSRKRRILGIPSFKEA